MTKGIVTGEEAEFAKESLGFVDVRDVSLAHLRALKVEEAKNKRFIVSSEDLWIREYAAMIAEVYTPRGFQVTTKEAEQGDDF